MTSFIIKSLNIGQWTIRNNNNKNNNLTTNTVFILTLMDVGTINIILPINFDVFLHI